MPRSKVEPVDKDLYEKVKKEADEKYTKPSAYKSGWIVKRYKELGGEYTGKKPKETGLERWFKEEWEDIGDKDYPVYRPKKRITKDTPLTKQEIDPKNLKEQIKLKQKLKGDKNLPPFKEKDESVIGIETEQPQELETQLKVGEGLYKILPYTLKQAKKLGVVVKPSKKKGKKIDVFKDGELVASVGGAGYKDYPTFWKTEGKAVADKKRKLYKARHEKDRHKEGSAGYYADKLLW